MRVGHRREAGSWKDHGIEAKGVAIGSDGKSGHRDAGQTTAKGRTLGMCCLRTSEQGKKVQRKRSLAWFRPTRPPDTQIKCLRLAISITAPQLCKDGILILTSRGH